MLFQKKHPIHFTRVLTPISGLVLTKCTQMETGLGRTKHRSISRTGNREDFRIPRMPIVQRYPWLIYIGVLTPAPKPNPTFVPSLRAFRQPSKPPFHPQHFLHPQHIQLLSIVVKAGRIYKNLIHVTGSALGVSCRLGQQLKLTVKI